MNNKKEEDIIEFNDLNMSSNNNFENDSTSKIVFENFNYNTNDDIKFNSYNNAGNISDDTDEVKSNMIDEYVYDYSNVNEQNKEKSNIDIKSFVKDKIDNMYLGYKTRLFINIFGILMFSILFLVLFINSISLNKKSNVIYKQISNIDYKVYLRENKYYGNNYLDKDMQYIASLIDNININFDYSFSFNQDINYKYTYYIKSEVKVTDSIDPSLNIYSKTNKLTEPNTIVKEDSNKFNINENISIDYNKYNDLVKSFKNTYLLNADSNLVLSMLVDIEDEKGNKVKNNDEVMKISIPLTEQTINIKMDYEEVNNSYNTKVYRHFSIDHKVLFAFSIFFLIGDIIYISSLVMFLNKTKTKKTIYDITLSKILREYDRVIVNSKKPIVVDGEIIELSSFSELLDVRDNLEKPIIFKEIHKGLKSIFIIRNKNETYRYVLKLSDLERGNKK